MVEMARDILPGDMRGELAVEVWTKPDGRYSGALVFGIGELATMSFDALQYSIKIGRPKPPNRRRPEARTLALPDDRSSRGWCLALADEVGTCGKTK